MERHCIMDGLASTFWSKRRVLITGHTGFKGTWLSLWLQALGAQVFGYSRSTSKLLNTSEGVFPIESFSGDICEEEKLRQAVLTSEAEIVIHMGAQPLVRRAYQDPIGTYTTNVIGTATLLQCVRQSKSVRVVMVVTTDKCYENKDWLWAYREIDKLGGHDPYSSSKACMEFVVSSFRNSFFHPDRFNEHQVATASIRAGNIIGGGDWSQDRLVPDMMRSFAAGQPVCLRNPRAMRPWQYVLETLRGYLLLAQHLHQDGRHYSGAWNFGPSETDIQPVEWIVDKLATAWGAEASWQIQEGNHPQEGQMLKLDCTKAHMELGWQPILNLSDALQMTVEWYRHFYAENDVREKYLEQIAAYSLLSKSNWPIVAPSYTANPR